jgi:hypothetical protein
VLVAQPRAPGPLGSEPRMEDHDLGLLALGGVDRAGAQPSQVGAGGEFGDAVGDVADRA